MQNNRRQKKFEILVQEYLKQKTFYENKYNPLIKRKKKELLSVEQTLMAGAKMEASEKMQTLQQYFTNGPLYNSYMPCGRGWYTDLASHKNAKEALAKAILMTSYDSKLWDYLLTESKLQKIAIKDPQSESGWRLIT